MGGIKNRRLRYSVIAGMWILVIVFFYFVLAHAPQKVERLEKAGDVEGLIHALDGDWATAWRAAEALGRLGDKRAVDPLIALLGAEHRDSKARASAAKGLAALGDLRAIPALIRAKNDTDGEIQASAGAAVISILDFGPAAIDQLTQYLTNWDVNKDVAEALRKHNWQPITEEQKIHLMVAHRDGAGINTNWELTREALMKDMQTCRARMEKLMRADLPPRDGTTTIRVDPEKHAQELKDLQTCVDDPERIRNALNALVSTGKEEVIPELIRELDSVNDKRVAEAYLNCGRGDLAEAAQAWAKSHGYEIKSTPNARGNAVWGHW
jgi:hypothetical protein